MLFYPAMKQLTLDLAATSFLGAGIGPEIDGVTAAFVDMVAAIGRADPQAAAGNADARAACGAARISSPISPAGSDPPRQAAATTCSPSYARRR